MLDVSPTPVWRLPERPKIDGVTRRRLEEDFERLGRDPWPASIETLLLERYQLDVSSTFAGRPIKNPWGKGSGQLSMTPLQVEEDAAAGLGFVVLKTVIAEDASGVQEMSAWAIKESRMVAERIVGRRSGRSGWTITWKGRGWWQSFDEYLALVRASTAIGEGAGMVVIPSCKCHLPTPTESTWKESEYRHTIGKLADAFAAGAPSAAFAIEKDFSPTLAGSDRASAKERILDWLTVVPGLIRRSAPVAVQVGLKLFNATVEDVFQVEMLRVVAGAKGAERADFLTYANRLFDPTRSFEGSNGVAYGGPDLSDRNLTTLDAYRDAEARGLVPPLDIPLSATGDIHSGRMAVEYALRGCSSFQLHTYFQLPAEEYPRKIGGKTGKALHPLYFHPTEGLIAWLWHVARSTDRIGENGIVRFRDLVGSPHRGDVENSASA